MDAEDEASGLRSVALQNAQSILQARRRAEDALNATKEALRESNERTNRILESITDGFAVFDSEWRCTYLNRRAETLLRPLHGPAASLLGQRLQELFPDMADSPLKASFRRAMNERVTVETEIYYAPLKCWLDMRAYPSQGGLTLYFLDITERKEESRVLELLSQTWMTVGLQFEVRALLQTVTDAATSLSGAKFGAFFYNQTDDKGDSYLLYTLSGAPREAFAKFGYPRATPLFGHTFRGESVIRCDDVHDDPRYGQWAPHHGIPQGHMEVRSYLAAPVVGRLGNVIGGLFFGHPEPKVFTERSEKLVRGIAGQAAIAIDNARLYETAQRAVADREKLLDSERAARSEAERASRIKDEFLATLSHELRTPLSAILGWSYVLQRNSADAKTLRTGLETIERNARAQTQLIEDLLDMSRITSGKLRLDIQPLAPDSFVQAAIDTVMPAAMAKGVQLGMTVDPKTGLIHGDAAKLQQVVWNLLSNAIKFTPKGGSVNVSIKRIESSIELRVADTGMGIGPDFLPYVFDRFRQADSSTTREFGGLGLGLSIVKHLVELHGGTVQVESRGTGTGTTFTARLPLPAVTLRSQQQDEYRRSSASSSSEPDEAKLAGLSFIVVDDDPDACNLLHRVLTDAGARVVVAGRAMDAIRLIAEMRPDAVISDIGMPEIDGYELIKRIKTEEQANGWQIPAVALTAFARPEDRARALEAGYVAHLTKPVEPGELVSTLAGVARKI